MYPEAGGSASFARRAFNEFWSFFAAWAQMLTYICTIAISAFFVPHYIGGAVLGAAAPRARRHHRRRVRDRRCWPAINIFGVKESTGVNVLLAVIDFMTQLLLVVVGGVLVLSPEVAGRQRPPRRRADLEGLHPRDPDRHARLHGHRDDLEHVRGGPRRGQDDPGGDQPRADRRVRHLLHAAGRRAVRAARAAARRRHVLHAAGPAGGAGRLRRRPDPRLRQADRPRAVAGGAASSTSACWRRRSCSSPPTRASSASRGSSTRWASTARCPTALRQLHPRFRTPWIGILVFSGLAILILLPGQEAFLGSIYSFGALLSFTMAHAAVIRAAAEAARTSRAPTAARATSRSATTTRRCSRSPAARFTAIAFVVIAALNLTVAAFGVGWLVVRHARLRGVPPPPRARPDLHATRSRSRSRSSTTRRSTTRCSCRSPTATTST